ncbi:MAG: hypothetical protein BWY09_01481 [Candidatus Hydrogenedentes bacterium ADurb.Bin179]|nr:MAG: hypothetical protein BWY09_01481 [Candidatus Hydrogenedentes bacterium ADurb.Bin179]
MADSPGIEWRNETESGGDFKRNRVAACAGIRTQSLLVTNREKYSLIRDGVQVAFRNGKGERVKERLRVVNFTDPTKNDFLCVRELWVRGDLYRRRTDIVMERVIKTVTSCYPPTLSWRDCSVYQHSEGEACCLSIRVKPYVKFYYALYSGDREEVRYKGRDNKADSPAPFPTPDIDLPESGQFLENIT